MSGSQKLTKTRRKGQRFEWRLGLPSLLLQSPFQWFRTSWHIPGAERVNPTNRPTWCSNIFFETWSRRDGIVACGDRAVRISTHSQYRLLAYSCFVTYSYILFEVGPLKLVERVGLLHFRCTSRKSPLSPTSGMVRLVATPS